MLQPRLLHINILYVHEEGNRSEAMTSDFRPMPFTSTASEIFEITVERELSDIFLVLLH